MRLELLPTPSPPRPGPRNDRHLESIAAAALLVVTLFTTITLGGAWTLLTRSDTAPAVLPLLTPANIAQVWRDPALLARGLAFALPTLFILLCHEAGHWLACRRHRLPTSAPFFLPAPLGLGTFGAFIHLRRPIRNRRELLDVGIWGPLAGFGALLPFLFAGAALSEPGRGAAGLHASGAPLHLHLGENLLISGVLRLVHGELPPGVVLDPHPFLLAAWVGCCSTMLNLLPLGRLDGGHVAYALSGTFQRRVAWPFWGGLVLLGALWPWWWLWSLLILLLGMRHPRVGDEELPLDPARKRLALVALALLVVTFIPVPLRVESERSAATTRSGSGRQLDDQGHRTVVDQLDRHVRAEPAARDRDSALAQALRQELDQGRRDLRWRRALERGAATAIERSQERELRNQEDRPARLREVEVHPPLGVVEESQADQLFGGPRHLELAVAALDPDHHDEAAPDRSDLLAVDRDPGARHPLQD